MARSSVPLPLVWKYTHTGSLGLPPCDARKGSMRRGGGRVSGQVVDSDGMFWGRGRLTERVLNLTGSKLLLVLLLGAGGD